MCRDGRVYVVDRVRADGTNLNACRNGHRCDGRGAAGGYSHGVEPALDWRVADGDQRSARRLPRRTIDTGGLRDRCGAWRIPVRVWAWNGRCSASFRCEWTSSAAISRTSCGSQKTFHIGSVARTLGVFVDAFNVNNQQIPNSDNRFAVNEASGSRFGAPGPLTDPRTLRIGLRFAF